ncbi:glycosyl transferase [Flavobacterium collinsii]|uniref:glycosyltransferase family 2 protein n=1 Tax=Flavobacterium collinsii TaxID=1114861 RepID=UPI0022BB8915|nr:glycosyltransferase family 2 protein [Flavobacterium collinsii]GIQ58562.1 glycosyl transferase [Flavobacterium collinsii]
MILPKVSIVMATYNRSHFILETLSSIENQTYLNWECLIIDDGGTDKTEEAIDPILKKEPRFKFFKRPDSYKKGLSGCRNYGIDLAEGDFIIFFDDDDFVHPDNLMVCLDTFKNVTVDFCHFQKLSFNIERPVIEKSEAVLQKGITKANIGQIVMQKIGLASCTVMWKIHCFKQIRFNEDLLYAEEWECYSKLISQGFSGIIIDSVLYYNRKHPDSNTGKFYNNNPVYKSSNKYAILLVLQNLKEKKLLTNELIRYFVSLSLDYKEYDLFRSIMETLDLSKVKRLGWEFFYKSYLLRKPIYKIKKRLKK